MATRHEILKWGTRRYFRCVAADSGGGSAASDQKLRHRHPSSNNFYLFGVGVGGGDSDHNRSRRVVTQPRRSAEDGGGEGIGEFREKMTSNIRTAAELIHTKQFVDEEEEEEQTKENEKGKEVSPPGVAAEVRPWKLRKSVAACEDPIPKPDPIPEPDPIHQSNGKGLRKVNSIGSRFRMTLTKKEIEDDFTAMMGHRPPRRPKKRPKSLQNHINELHPTYYFTIINEDLYDVTKKRKR